MWQLAVKGSHCFLMPNTSQSMGWLMLYFLNFSTKTVQWHRLWTMTAAHIFCLTTFLPSFSKFREGNSLAGDNPHPHRCIPSQPMLLHYYHFGGSEFDSYLPKMEGCFPNLRDLEEVSLSNRKPLDFVQWIHSRNSSIQVSILIPDFCCVAHHPSPATTASK